MTCHVVKAGGVMAIVCTSGRTMRCACGGPGALLCDWKLGKGKTCDTPMCQGCAKEVAPEKHLCRAHQADYAKWLEKKVPR
jgi:hypothetical protein